MPITYLISRSIDPCALISTVSLKKTHVGLIHIAMCNMLAYVPPCRGLGPPFADIMALIIKGIVVIFLMLINHLVTLFIALHLVLRLL